MLPDQDYVSESERGRQQSGCVDGVDQGGAYCSSSSCSSAKKQGESKVEDRPDGWGGYDTEAPLVAADHSPAMLTWTTTNVPDHEYY